MLIKWQNIVTCFHLIMEDTACIGNEALSPYGLIMAETCCRWIFNTYNGPFARFRTDYSKGPNMIPETVDPKQKTFSLGVHESMEHDSPDASVIGHPIVKPESVQSVPEENHAPLAMLQFAKTIKLFAERSDPRKQQTSNPNAPVFEYGQSSYPNIASFSRTHKTDDGPFTNVEDEPLGGSFHMSPPRSTHAPPAGETSGGAEDLITLTTLSSVVSTLMHKSCSSVSMLYGLILNHMLGGSVHHPQQVHHQRIVIRWMGQTTYARMHFDALKRSNLDRGLLPRGFKAD
nr:hypothetical protein [Tanacetum cinerariifolium]